MSTFLLDAEETEKKKTKNKKSKQTKKSNTHFLGGLENGQDVVPPFFPKNRVFQNPQKNLFYSVSRKMGGNHFFSKRLCYKEDRFRGAKKMKTFWCLLDRNV